MVAVHHSVMDGATFPGSLILHVPLPVKRRDPGNEVGSFGCLIARCCRLPVICDRCTLIFLGIISTSSDYQPGYFVFTFIICLIKVPVSDKFEPPRSSNLSETLLTFRIQFKALFKRRATAVPSWLDCTKYGLVSYIEFNS